MAPRAVPAHTDSLVPDCPVLDGSAAEAFAACRRASREFTRRSLTFLERRDQKAQVAWLKVCVEGGRPVFQPWNMEILFVLGTCGAVRFTRLQRLLGLSSRTLSDKLKALEDEGLVQRTVQEGPPVRVDYRLTRTGARTAQFAAPLFAHLNLAVLERAGRV